jgi:hypothetical protein
MVLEENAKRSERRKPDIQADLGDAAIGDSEQMLGSLDSKARVELLRCFAEYRSKRTK